MTKNIFKRKHKWNNYKSWYSPSKDFWKISKPKNINKLELEKRIGQNGNQNQINNLPKCLNFKKFRTRKISNLQKNQFRIIQAMLLRDKASEGQKLLPSKIALLLKTKEIGRVRWKKSQWVILCQQIKHLLRMVYFLGWELS